MPLKPFQRNYWLNSDTRVAPISVGRGGYPAWQISIVGSLWGAMGDHLVALWRRVCWAWWLRRRVVALDRDRQVVLLRTLDVLESPHYPLAFAAVKATATTAGFHRPEVWKGLWHGLKTDVGQAENTFRHLNTVALLREAARQAGSTLTNPELHFLSEVAYQGYAIKGR